MSRTPSTKALAHKLAQDSSQAPWTRWEAILTLEQLIPGHDLEILIRQLLADTKKGRVVRLCLEKLAAREEAKSHRAEVDSILAEETARLAKKTAMPTAPIPAPVVHPPKHPPSGQKYEVPDPKADAAGHGELALSAKANETVVSNISPTPTPVPVPVGAPPNGPQSEATARDPRPVWNLPRGAVLDRDEQTRLLELFRTASDSTKTEDKRRAAKAQLEKTVPVPDAGRSLFAVYLLALLVWLERHPEERIGTLPGETPGLAAAPNPEYDAFTFNFSVTRWFQNIAEQERILRARRQVKDYVEQGGMWDGLPKCVS